MLPEDTVHQMHKSRWSIGQSERQDEELKMSVPSSEGGLGYICRVDSNLVVPTLQVDLREKLGTLEPVE